MRSLPILFICFLVIEIHAQIDPDLKPSLLKGGSVTAVERYDNGKILVAGNFAFAETTQVGNLFRLNTDGTLDNSFNPQVSLDNGQIRDILIQDDGKIILAGSFTYSNKNYLVRINTDGTLDNTFNTGSGPNGAIFKIVNRMAGGFLIQGEFTAYNDEETKFITAIDEDGTLSDAFDKNAGSYSGATYSCGYFSSSLEQQADGKIIYSNSCGEKAIIRLNEDGTLDNSFNLPSDIIMESIKVIILPGDKVIAGGYIDFEGSSDYRIMGFNSDGSKDDGFTIVNPIGAVYNIVSDENGRILYSDNSFSALNRINADGTVDATFSSVTFVSQSSFIYDLMVEPDGSIWIGGNNLTISGGDRQLVKLTSAGAETSTILPFVGTPATIFDAAVDASGRILIYGDFTTVNAQPTKHLVRLLPSGIKDESFITEITDITQNGFDIFRGRVNVQADGKVLLTAQSIDINGVGTKTGIVRFEENGSYDASFAPVFSVGTNNSINTVEVREDKILLAGDFDNTDAVAGNIVVLNGDGSTDNTFNATLDFMPRTAIFLPDNKIMVGGGNVFFTDRTNGNLIRLNEDGSMDNTFVWNHFDDHGFSTTCPIHINKTSQGIFVGARAGYFNSSKDHIAYLDESGKPLKSFVNALHSLREVSTSIELPNKLLIYGSFNSSSLRIVYPTGKPFELSVVVNNYISKILRLSDSKVLVLGAFSRVNDVHVGGAFALDLGLLPSDEITDFTASVDPDTVKLTWSHPDSKALFEIFRSDKPAEGFVKIARLIGREFQDDNATLGKTNYYKIRQINIAGEGPFTESISIEVPSNTLPVPVISVTNLGFGDMEVSWLKIKTYDIQIQWVEDTFDLSVKPYDYLFSGTGHAGSGPRVRFPGFKENTKYFFRARTAWEGKFSEYSDFIKVATGTFNLMPPYNLSVNNAGAGAILTWADTSKASSGVYEIWRNSGGRFERFATAKDTFYLDPNASISNLDCHYSIRSIATLEGNIIYSDYSPVVTLITHKLVTGSWTAVESVSGARADAVAFSVGSYGYLGLGYNGSYLNDFYKFDPVNSSWSPVDAFPGAGRSDAVAFVIDGKAYVGGGTDGNNNGLKDFYEYDPLENSWKRVADFPDDAAGNEGLVQSVSFSSVGMGYVTMITRTGGIKTSELWAYSPISNSWIEKENFPGSLQQNGIAVEKDGFGYVGMGGTLSVNEEWWRYDTNNDWWSVQSKPSGHSSKSPVGLNYNGFIYAATGNTSSDFFTATYGKHVNHFHYNNFWQSTSLDLPAGRASATGFVIAERMYIGTGYNGTYLEDFYEYKPAGTVTVGMVSDLSATYVSDNTIDLMWDFNGYLATALEIEFAEDPSAFTNVATTPVSQTSYRLTELEPNKKYYARVRVRSIEGAGEYVTIEFYTKPKPAIPSGLNAVALSSESIQLSWADNVDETGYEVWRTSDYNSANYIRVGVLPANEVSFTDNNCVYEKTYYYKIKAVNAAGFSDFSPLVTATALPLTPPVPQNLTVTAVGSTFLSLSWTNDPTAYIYNTEIYYKTAGSSTFSHGGFSYGTTFDLTGLTPGTQYTIVILNSDFGTTSDESDPVDATTLEDIPSAPFNFSGVATSDNNIDLTWEYAGRATDDGFVMQRSDDDDTTHFVSLDTIDITLRKFSDNTVETLKTYRYRMFAFTNGGISDTTSTVSVWAKTLPNAPSGLIVRQDTVTKIFLNWIDNANNEDGFIIQTLNILNNQFETVDTVAANTTSYLHEGLSESRIFTYKVVAYNVAGSTETEEVQTMNFIVGIEKLIGETIMIYPNPGKGRFKIKVNSSKWQVEIFDFTGKMIQSYAMMPGKSYHTSFADIDLTEYPSGIYLVRLRVKDEVAIRKLIKQD